MVLSLLLVELMIFELWGMLTSPAGSHRTSVPSNCDCKLGFKALKLLIIPSCGPDGISRDRQAYSVNAPGTCINIANPRMHGRDANASCYPWMRTLLTRRCRQTRRGVHLMAGRVLVTGCRQCNFTSLHPSLYCLAAPSSATSPHAEPCSCLQPPVVGARASPARLHCSHGRSRLMWPVTKPCYCLA